MATSRVTLVTSTVGGAAGSPLTRPVHIRLTQAGSQWLLFVPTVGETCVSREHPCTPPRTRAGRRAGEGGTRHMKYDCYDQGAFKLSQGNTTCSTLSSTNDK